MKKDKTFLHAKIGFKDFPHISQTGKYQVLIKIQILYQNDLEMYSGVLNLAINLPNTN